MARPIKWKQGKFKKLKFKIYEPTLKRYKQILDAKNKSMQQDFEDHVNQTIK